MRKENEITFCHECERGGNGNDQDKCSCGFERKKPTRFGCLLGKKILVEIAITDNSDVSEKLVKK